MNQIVTNHPKPEPQLPLLPPELMELFKIRLDRLDEAEQSLIVLAAIEAIADFAAGECADFSASTDVGMASANQRADTYVATFSVTLKRALLEQFSPKVF